MHAVTNSPMQNLSEPLRPAAPIPVSSALDAGGVAAGILPEPERFESFKGLKGLKRFDKVDKA